MILSKLVVQWLEWIIEIGIWLSLIGAFLVGYQAADGFFMGLVAGVFSTIISGVFCALVFGAFIVLLDMRTSLRELVANKKE